MGSELAARACGTEADILEYIVGKGGMLVCGLHTDDNGSDGELSQFVTPDQVTNHVTGQVTCHRTFLSLFMFVYLCLVTCPILETVYSSHAEGTYFPQPEYQL